MVLMLVSDEDKNTKQELCNVNTYLGVNEIQLWKTEMDTRFFQ